MLVLLALLSMNAFAAKEVDLDFYNKNTKMQSCSGHYFPAVQVKAGQCILGLAVFDPKTGKVAQSYPFGKKMKTQIRKVTEGDELSFVDWPN